MKKIDQKEKIQLKRIKRNIFEWKQYSIPKEFNESDDFFVIN